MVTTGARRVPPADTKCPPAAQRKQAKRACIYIYIYINRVIIVRIYTGWLISSDTSFFRYKISYTRTILVIMIFRDCNSNILNGFKRFFVSKTWNCVLYGEFYGEKCVLARSKNRESRSQLL